MCVEAGAGALGFNFYPGSKRFIEPKKSFAWIRSFKNMVDCVAVVVNADLDLISRIRDSGCFAFIQFHGDESPRDCEASGFESWIRAVRVKDQSALHGALDFSTAHLLLDAMRRQVEAILGETEANRLWREFLASLNRELGQ